MLAALLAHPNAPGAGPCPPCPRVVSASCFCGAVVTDKRCGRHEFSCGGVCGAVLPCGHTCPATCHDGECPPCGLVSTVPCRCGAEARQLPCSQQGAFQVGREPQPHRASCTVPAGWRPARCVKVALPRGFALLAFAQRQRVQEPGQRGRAANRCAGCPRSAPACVASRWTAGGTLARRSAMPASAALAPLPGPRPAPAASRRCRTLAAT